MNTILKKKYSGSFDSTRIGELSENLQLHPRLIELLLSRGIEGEKEISCFLHPDKKNFSDPFLMKGMKEAVARIKVAIEGRERIIVYGDYDADGVCSSAILSLYLKSKGLDVVVHIPNRISEGYGLNVVSIETLIDEFCPDLLLTCDCGISGIDEAAHCQDLGVDIIITDHHEPGESIPDCIVVNPKQQGDGYPDKYLCGAGVALKLVQALCNDETYLEYLDIAAVATIADLVPLMNENRLIVQLGLQMMGGKRCNYGLKKLLLAQNISGSVTSSDIAYKIAPRINAAGRMGDAYRAFEMLTICDEARVNSIIADIDGDNDKRKDVCDKIYDEAEIDLMLEDIVNNRAIILSNPEWAKGVTGIAAARFAGDYNRPTFILVDRTEDGVFKGTARGIAGINIFDALSYCSDILIEFGGHTGAAGFSVAEENIPAFKVRINEYMAQQPEEYFVPSLCYDLDVGADECNKRFLEAMSLVEPTGNSNTKPLLRIKTNTVKLSPCKNPQHSSVVIGNLQTYAFNFYSRNQFMMGNDEKDIVLELTDGLNGGVSGYIKGVSPSVLYINDALAPANYLASLLLPGVGNADYITYESGELNSLLPTSIYGTLFVCADRKSYDAVEKLHCEKFVTRDYMFKSEKNNYSGIIVSPFFDSGMNLGNYEKIVFADDPPTLSVVSWLNGKTNAAIYVPAHKDNRIFAGITADRGVFAKYYSTIINNTEAANGNMMLYYKRLSMLAGGGIDARQFVVCFAVFRELGFLTLSGNRLTVNAGVHRPLTESPLYNTLVSVN